jgi:hypothetical protein
MRSGPDSKAIPDVEMRSVAWLLPPAMGDHRPKDRVARWTAEVGARRHDLIAVYIVGMFLVLPIVILFVT